MTSWLLGLDSDATKEGTGNALPMNIKIYFFKYLKKR